MTAPRNERGFALAGAIFTLVIIAALIGGAFFASRQETTVGRNTQTYQRAFGAAEAGLNNTVASWSVGSFNALANGDSSTVTGTLPGNGGSYTTVVRRLNNELFLVRTTGTDPSGSSVRTVAAITKLLTVAMNFRASLTTRTPDRPGRLVLTRTTASAPPPTVFTKPVVMRPCETRAPR